MTFIFAFDATDQPDHPEVVQPMCDWLTANDLKHGIVHRIELHILDDKPVIRVFEFLQKNGHAYVDLETGDVARRDPYDVPLKVAPPAALVPDPPAWNPGDRIPWNG